MAVSQFNDFLLNKEISDVKVLITDGNTHTAQQAAEVHNVPVSNIVKSLLVFTQIGCEIDYKMILVPGNRRLDLDYWKEYFDVVVVRMATADEVKKVTGFSIGGVPPFGHLKKLDTYIANGFDGNSELAAAAGSSKAVFKISLDRLKILIKL